MGIITETYELENGIKIPKVGFGTWQIPNGEATYNSVTYALKNGYRHIDTANGYENEESVGKAVRDSGINREDIFVTSKLRAEIKTYEGALDAFEDTMEQLGLEYVDLYLIHAPWPWSEIGKDCTKENIEVWKAMEEIYKSGRAKAIGVSNFNVNDLKAILETCTVKPMANQIRYFIGDTQDEITNFCKENGILVEGYSPLATGKLLKNEDVAELAKKYNVSVPQICIRYVIQKGVLPLPKSTHEEYIINNANVDFEISDEDMNYLDGLKNTTN
ncbi:aldo/keto reductase [Haloplasma contractile]|uniref:1-deoxy-D-xylulose-5-phosphate reductoisomerase protein n=1 Tax=Haloplasma contractile SSD-17B TaxID=1033810 RepID=F7Q137_9MOLU|nr:aldo/keto reductase [Haloplasma contractile]ERJ11321.1 1-deoxy-D-xylulose-5-phosphate reductoisomerase protein [Haloplasma contractile SSD-17B]